jgi:hypothetical protein
MINIPPLYFVEVDYGRAGRSFVETDRDKNSRQSVIQDIADGQYENGTVVRVLAVFEDEDRCRDVTDDIRDAVSQLIYQRGSEWPAHLEDFLRAA